MKCSKCGYKAKDISHMAAHYRKMHPKAMSKKKTIHGVTMTRKQWEQFGVTHGWY